MSATEAMGPLARAEGSWLAIRGYIPLAQAFMVSPLHWRTTGRCMDFSLTSRFFDRLGRGIDDLY